MGYNTFHTEEDMEVDVDMDVTGHAAPSGKVKQAVVENVALADALVKDGGTSWTSPSLLKLYPVIMLITLSMYIWLLRMS
jgi:hypothetical protein